MKIFNTVYQQLIDHSKEGLPLETCGYLAGTGDVITTFFPMTNVDASSEHFSFDPKEQFSVVKQARNKGLTILAVYHSHPETPARLSQEDLRLLSDPNMVYIIVSLQHDTPDIQGFKILKTDDRIDVTHQPLEQVIGD